MEQSCRDCRPTVTPRAEGVRTTSERTRVRPGAGTGTPVAACRPVQPAVDSSRPAATPAKPPQILLAEDDEELRGLITAVLREDGFSVCPVSSGGELLEYIETSLLHSSLKPRPHLLITDVRMPGLSGLDVISILADSECLPRTIVITAFPSEETKLTALERGAAAVLGKPFDIDELRGEVARQLRRR